MFSPVMRRDACSRRCDFVALKRPRFPILAFDESELSLSRGSAFNPKWLMPGESLISMLWKFACANVLPGDVLMHLISPCVNRYINLRMNIAAPHTINHSTHVVCTAAARRRISSAPA